MTKIIKQTKAFLKLWNSGELPQDYDWNMLPKGMFEEINELYDRGYKDAVLAYDRMGLEYLYKNSDYNLPSCMIQIVINIFPVLEDDVEF